MKVLHFITSLIRGGAQSVLCDLLEYWQDTGVNNFVDHHVIYIHDGPSLKRIQNLCIPTYKLTYNLLIMHKLGKLVKQIQPDVIHSSLWSANLLSRFVSKKYTIPLVCHLHNNISYNGKLRTFLDNVLITQPKKFIAVSDSVKKSFANNKTLLKKTIVIQNGIDSNKLRLLAAKDCLSKKDLCFEEDDFVIGTVGRLTAVKRYDLLLKAFAQLETKKAKLCIVGGGEQQNDLQNLAQNLGIQKRVLFTGEQGDVYRYYPAFDCFVLSSQTEGLSIALLEALVFGLPIITTSQDDSHDVITNGINGFVVPINNVKRLAMALQTLATNPTILSAMNKANRNLVDTTFHIDNMAKQHLDMYKAVANK